MLSVTNKFVCSISFHKSFTISDNLLFDWFIYFVNWFVTLTLYYYSDVSIFICLYHYILFCVSSSLNFFICIYIIYYVFMDQHNSKVPWPYLCVYMLLVLKWVIIIIVFTNFKMLLYFLPLPCPFLKLRKFNFKLMLVMTVLWTMFLNINCIYYFHNLFTVKYKACWIYLESRVHYCTEYIKSINILSNF